MKKLILPILMLSAVFTLTKNVHAQMQKIQFMQPGNVATYRVYKAPKFFGDPFDFKNYPKTDSSRIHQRTTFKTTTSNLHLQSSAIYREEFDGKKYTNVYYKATADKIYKYIKLETPLYDYQTSSYNSNGIPILIGDRNINVLAFEGGKFIYKQKASLAAINFPFKDIKDSIIYRYVRQSYGNSESRPYFNPNTSKNISAFEVKVYLEYETDSVIHEYGYGAPGDFGFSGRPSPVYELYLYSNEYQGYTAKALIDTRLPNPIIYSEYIVSETKGTNDLQTAEVANLQISPNPVENNLQFNFNGIVPKQIQILDITGKLILNNVPLQTNNIINVSNLNAGIYVVSVMDNNLRLSTQKFIKN